MRDRTQVFGWMLAAVVLAGGMGCGQQDQQQDVSQTQEGDLVLGQSEVVNELNRAVAPDGRPLVLTGFNGTVRLDGTDSSVARLTFIKRGRGQDDAAARDVLDGVQLVERGNTSRFEYVMRSQQSARSEVDVRGTVPREAELRIGYESGAVALSGVEGPIDVEHQSGNVQIVRELRVDCDGDAVLMKVEQRGGAACHTGRRSCFFRRRSDGGWEDDGVRVFDPEEVYGR